MWRALLVLSATGCNVVLGIEDLEGPTCFADDFENGLDLMGTWQEFTPGSPTEIVANAGGVLISPPPGIISENGIFTRPTFDWSDGAVEVEVDTQSVQDGFQTFFLLFDQTRIDTGFGLIAADGNLIARTFVVGAESDVMIAFQPTFRFWRISHSAASDQVLLDVSANQRDYVNVRKVDLQPEPRVYRARLQAGRFNGSQNVGNALFEGITTTAASCE